MPEPERPTQEATTPMGGVVPTFDGSELPHDLWEDLRHAFEPRYQLRGILGRGGMGIVVDAYDPVLERPLAIKILIPDALREDSTARERLLREARAAATLSHPNVVSVFGVGETPALRAPYILMQQIVGETLERREENGTLIDVAGASRLLGEVAEALSIAHGRGMVHRDLKPSNVMLDRETGRAVVLDFGISHFTPTSGRQEAKLTGTGMYVGTPLYMSPEQAAGEPATAKSDIYSLGCLMYEVLAGRRVFDGESAMVVMAAHIKDVPAPIRTFRPEVPLAFERTLAAMLAKDPALRPSADDLRRQFAPVPEDHPWISQRLREARGLLRATGFLGIALGGITAIVMSRLGQLEHARPGAVTTVTTALVVTLALLFLAYALQAVRAFLAVKSAALSWDLVRLLAGDGQVEVGRIADRLQRFALLNPEMQRALLDRKRVLGTGILLAGPATLALLWLGGTLRTVPSGRGTLEWVAFGIPLVVLLVLKQRHDRLEQTFLGETALTIRRFRRPLVDHRIAGWLSKHAALLGSRGPGRGWILGVIGVMAMMVIGAQVALLGLIQFTAASLGPLRRQDRASWRAQYAELQPLLASAERVGPPIQPGLARVAWDSLYGRGVDTAALRAAPTPLGYWDHRALFPGTPEDSSSWGNEMFAAVRGLSTAQREYLVAITRFPALGALPTAARSDEDPFWAAAIARAESTGTSPWEQATESWVFGQSMDRALSLAALLVADQRFGEAELLLKRTMRVARLRAEAGRAGWDWTSGVRRVIEADQALAALRRGTGRGREAVSRYTLRFRRSTDAIPDTGWTLLEGVADSTLSPGARWSILWRARYETCRRPSALWADRDAGFDSVAGGALAHLGRGALDTTLIWHLGDALSAGGRRFVSDDGVPWYTLPLVRFAGLMGRSQLAGCLSVGIF